MIVADRREGSLQSEPEAHSAGASLWRNLDRNIPLGIKLIVPVILVTLAGTGLFGFLLAQQLRLNIESSNVASARRLADTSAADFAAQRSNPAAVNYTLITVTSDEPNVVGVWIVDLSVAGNPVVSSSIPSDVSRTDLLGAQDAAAIQLGATVQDRTLAGGQVLETVVPVAGLPYAVVVQTSLKGEAQAVQSTLIWVAIAAAVVCAVEVGAMMAILEFGVLRRVRRVRSVVDAFGLGRRSARLSEGLEPEGRDALFNLARLVDQKLVELSERERAGNVVSELGLLALQGAQPGELSRKALDLTREAADLERCFLVELRGRDTIVKSFDAGGAEISGTKLPIWLNALVRAATQARRPILADSLGEESRYWEAGLEGAAVGAALVPLAGTPDPIGVMVGVARPGAHISGVGISMMEAVATALSESLQRNEAERARHESEIKSKALATVSHEMRNPLNAMLGFSNLLLNGAAGPLNEKQQNYVRRVDDASHHLLRLVNDYLDLARVMAGSLPMQPELVAVAPEVQSVLDMLRPTAEAKNVMLRGEIAPDAVAFADRMRLRQVVVNLVSHAIKFTPARGYVRVEVAGGSNGVRMSVIDTGIGIPAERQHLVFTEFAQLRSDSKGGDAGLGLALSKRFVDAMGGFIRFTSSEGAGTIFDVWLPGERSPRAGAAGAGAAEKDKTVSAA